MDGWMLLYDILSAFPLYYLSLSHLGETLNSKFLRHHVHSDAAVHKPVPQWERIGSFDLLSHIWHLKQDDNQR